MSSKNFVRSIVALALVAVAAPAMAVTTLVSGGDVFTAAGWTNGIPSPGNDGTITVDGVYSAPSYLAKQNGGSVSVVHSAGAITDTGGSDWNLYNTGYTAQYYWTIAGGSMTLGRNLIANEGSHYTLSSGTLASTYGAPQIEAVNNGTFVQTGGTLDGFCLVVNNATTMSLSGGSAINVARSTWTPQALWANSGATIAVSGTHCISFKSTVSADDALALLAGSKLEFSDDWAGSWTRDNFTVAEWTTCLTNDAGSVYVGDTKVTTDNFSSLFHVGNAGAVGSNLRLVPEPGTITLLSFGLIGLLCYAWRRRK